MYYEYRIVKIEKGLFLIEYKTAPYGVLKFLNIVCWLY